MALKLAEDINYLACEHNTIMTVGFKPASSWSRVWHLLPPIDGPQRDKPVFGGFQTKRDSKQSPQLQSLARKFKFQL